MLTIVARGPEMYDESSEKFFTDGDVTLNLEHSLVSLSKWESIFEKPFLDDTRKTPEEFITYVKVMTLTPDVPDETYDRLSAEDFETIAEYIDAKRTATWFSEVSEPNKSNEVITSELIYYYLVAFSISFECETWHLNRLFTLIRICNLKQSKPKKLGRAEQAAQNRLLNERRKAQLGTKG